MTRPVWFRSSPTSLLTNITVSFRCLHVTISGKVFTTTNAGSKSVFPWFICSHTTSDTFHFCCTILVATSTDSLKNKFKQDIYSLTVEILHAFLSSVEFFKINFLKNSFSLEFFQIQSKCKTVWNQIRPKILSDLIWIQTVCKSYKQTTLVG